MENRADLRRILIPGAIAGVGGGVLLGICFWLTAALPQYPGAVALLQFVASAAIGKGAFSTSGYAWLGLVMHLCASAGWGIGYAYLAQTRAAVNARPAISGIIFGLVVWLVMQVVLGASNSLPAPAVRTITLEIVAHTLFFGVTVAYVSRALLRPIAA